MTITSPRNAILLLLLVSFFWGSEFVLIDLAVAILPTHSFNAVRFSIAALSLLPLLWFARENIAPGTWPKLLAAGLLLGFLLFIGFYTQTEGLRYTSVSNAGFITGLNVPLVPVMGYLLFRNRVGKNVWLGIIIATLGLYFLTMGGALTLNRGDLLVLTCAFAFAVHIVLTGRFVDKMPVILLSIIQLFAVAIYSALAAWLSPDPAFYHPEATPVSWPDQLNQPVIIWALLVSALLGTAYAYWAQSACQTVIEPHKVALVFATEPIFAHASAWLFLDEHLGLQGFIGAGMILGGMLISELGDRRRKASMKPLEHTAAVD
ncbi:DMT family transporter [Neptuniibacter halophilus]|uniref:DMT family transporter n=1 Tax=Neptuniibacter halophilus TaxID=651666 RepID=UPI0025730613|nr:DMT family transporter [Neptuniibacter halophilus]